MNRSCSKCGAYNSKEMTCKYLGKILNPEVGHCSWWELKEKVKSKYKQCSRCGEIKYISEFCKMEGNKKDGLNYYCRDCANQYQKEYYGNTR